MKERAGSFMHNVHKLHNGRASILDGRCFAEGTYDEMDALGRKLRGCIISQSNGGSRAKAWRTKKDRGRHRKLQNPG